MNIKNLKIRVTSFGLSLAVFGGASIATAMPVFAEDEVFDATKIEQSIDEGKEEAPSAAPEEKKEEVKEEVKSEETVQEEKTEEVKTEEVKSEETTTETPIVEEKKEEVKQSEEGTEEISNEKEESQQPVQTKAAKSLTSENAASEENGQKNETTTREESEVHKVQTTTAKVDENGEPIVGALIQILDKDGNVVDEWISDGTDHITMLPEGDYILHEVAAPNGYIKAADKEFSIKVEVKDLNAGVDFSETPCEHYGGTPLYYIEMESQKSEVYCINQDWETPDENSIYDGMVLGSEDIRNFTRQTIYTDSHQNTNKIDVSDQSLNDQQLYDKILDIIYHRQLAVELFDDLTPAEIRYITESALKNYTNAGLTRVQRVGINSTPTGYDKYDFYETEDGRYVWYLYPWYRSFVYNPNAPLGTDIFTTVIGEGDAFGNLARHWSSGHNAKNSDEVRAKIARYYELYQYLVSDQDHHPVDMHLYIYSTPNQATDTSGFDFDNGAYQNLLGITWFNPYDENYAVDLDLINIKEVEPPEEPEKPVEPDKPVTPGKTVKTEKVAEKTVIKSSPQTGDDSNLALAFAGLGSSMAALGTAIYLRRKENEKVKAKS